MSIFIYSDPPVSQIQTAAKKYAFLSYLWYHKTSRGFNHLRIKSRYTFLRTHIYLNVTPVLLTFLRFNFQGKRRIGQK